MKQGRTLEQLVIEVERQAKAKKDALVQTNSLAMNTNGHSLLWLGGSEPFGVQPFAHRQIADHIGVPFRWYDEMMGHVADWKTPDGGTLFDTTVNSLFQARPTDERRLVRTLDGNARAFLSDRYRALDNLPVMAAILPVLQDIKGIDWQNASMEVTDRKLYLQLVNQDLQANVVPGTHNRLDIVAAGVVISNSEIGAGAFRVQPMLYRLVCSNGLIITEQAKAKYHIGGVLGDDSGEAFNWLSDDTLKARSEATIKEMRDVVRGALNEAMFNKAVESAREASGVKMQGDPVKAVEWVTDKFGFTEIEQAGVLRNLIEGADLSLWGMVNAITAQAQAADVDYDRSVDLETAGGKLLALPKHEVTNLVNAN